jgi:hypothetical protein
VEKLKDDSFWVAVRDGSIYWTDALWSKRLGAPPFKSRSLRIEGGVVDLDLAVALVVL